MAALAIASGDEPAVPIYRHLAEMTALLAGLERASEHLGDQFAMEAGTCHTATIIRLSRPFTKEAETQRNSVFGKPGRTTSGSIIDPKKRPIAAANI